MSNIDFSSFAIKHNKFNAFLARNQKVTHATLIASLIINIIFASHHFFLKMNSPSNSGGVLKRDVKVYFNIPNGQKEVKSSFLVLPQGLTVRDDSPRGFNAIGHFEPYRFKIVFTSDDANIVDYDIDTKGVEGLFGYHSVK